MFSPRYYTPQNVDRARYAQIGVALLAAATCAYLAISTLMGVREVWHAKRMLQHRKTESLQLLREAADLRAQRSRQTRLRGGGVESFAVHFADWAAGRGVKVDSLTPEGAPCTTEIEVGTTKLGAWKANKVRVKGSGRFPQLMDLLDEFLDPDMPVRLEAFGFQSSDCGSAAKVGFDLLLTVYQKNSGAS